MLEKFKEVDVAKKEREDGKTIVSKREARDFEWAMIKAAKAFLVEGSKRLE